MSNNVQRGLRIIEALAAYPEGRTLTELAVDMEIPLSATHRLLADLVACGYARKHESHGKFSLTMHLVSLSLGYLSASGIDDVAQPALERLAAGSGELVRLAVVDNDRLVFVAKAQGALTGLRYDPEMGRPVTLSCSAAGFAWLSTMSEEEAVRLVSEQGFGASDRKGPKAPSSVKALLKHVEAARQRGFSTTTDIFAPGMSSMAAPVRGRQGDVVAILIIAGPATRLHEKRMLELAPALLSAVDELSTSSAVSPMFKRKPERAVNLTPR